MAKDEEGAGMYKVVKMGYIVENRFYVIGFEN